MARYDNRDWDRRPDRQVGGGRGGVYDPDHAYRSRRHPAAATADEPYAQRPMPGEHADTGRDRHLGRRQADEEHAWAEPSAWYGAGRYRGVGPKGYVRSDERIREQVCDDLTDDPWLDASRIEVAVADGEVTLSGSVDSRDAKRWAEDVAHHAGGVKHVQNNLRIEAPG